jgi:hypothetical protein
VSAARHVDSYRVEKKAMMKIALVEPPVLQKRAASARRLRRTSRVFQRLIGSALKHTLAVRIDIVR